MILTTHGTIKLFEKSTGKDKKDGHEFVFYSYIVQVQDGILNINGNKDFSEFLDQPDVELQISIRQFNKQIKLTLSGVIADLKYKRVK
jgi:hypothetical protein